MAKGDYLKKPQFGTPTNEIERAAAEWLEANTGTVGESVMRSLADLILSHVKPYQGQLIAREAERKAVAEGRGIIKNGRYFNTGKTHEPDGRVRFDFDARNAHDPAFNGLVFSHYEDDQPVFKKP